MTTRLSNIHPGEVILEEFLKPLGISQNKLAKELCVPPCRINEICLGKRSLSIDTALRLSKYFDIEYEFWIHLQNMYDMVRKKQDIYKKIKPYQNAITFANNKKAG